MSMGLPRYCQREGVHKRGNQGEAKVGKGKGAKGGNAKRTFSNGEYPRGWFRGMSKGEMLRGSQGGHGGVL